MIACNVGSNLVSQGELTLGKLREILDALPDLDLKESLIRELPVFPHKDGSVTLNLDVKYSLLKDVYGLRNPLPFELSIDNGTIKLKFQDEDMTWGGPLDQVQFVKNYQKNLPAILILALRKISESAHRIEAKQITEDSYNGLNLRVIRFRTSKPHENPTSTDIFSDLCEEISKALKNLNSSGIRCLH